MGLFSKKKKHEPESNSPDSFDIDDIDLPPLPGDDSSSNDLQFSKQPENKDLPPLPEPPKPMNYNQNLPKRQAPANYPQQQQAPPQMPPQQNYPQQPIQPMPTQPQKKEDDSKVKAPVFVRIDKYKEVINSVKSLRGDLEKLNASLDSLRESKNNEEEIIAGWNGLLSEVASKLNRIDDELFEPEE